MDMEIEKEIQQSKFASLREKAAINLIFTTNSINQKTELIFKEHGLTPQQYNILRILKGQYPIPVSVKTIKERMLDRMSDVSRLVERLKVKNLVERSECPNDRRNVDILISTEGLKKLEELYPSVDCGMKNAVNLTDEELVTLNTLLDKLRG